MILDAGTANRGHGQDCSKPIANVSSSKFLSRVISRLSLSTPQKPPTYAPNRLPHPPFPIHLHAPALPNSPFHVTKHAPSPFTTSTYSGLATAALHAFSSLLALFPRGYLALVAWKNCRSSTSSIDTTNSVNSDTRIYG